jgi:hypothetical protein
MQQELPHRIRKSSNIRVITLYYLFCYAAALAANRVREGPEIGGGMHVPAEI